jgi:hypothetical protein
MLKETVFPSIVTKWQFVNILSLFTRLYITCGVNTEPLKTMKEISNKACPGGVVIWPPALTAETSAKLEKKNLLWILLS